MRVALFVVALLGLLGLSSAQLPFNQVSPSGDIWTARSLAAVELVKSTRTFNDGALGGRPTQLTNYILLYGGQTQTDSVNDVWATTNGRNWYWVAGYADGQPHPYQNGRYSETFPAWYEAATCQDNNFRQYRTGGRRDGQLHNDVWTSIDGLVWTQRTELAEWSERYLHSMVADTANNVYLAGGILEDAGSGGRPRRSSGEVWMSLASSTGARWTQMNVFDDEFDAVNDGPSRRAVSMLLSTGSNQLIWLTGVNTGYGPNDVDPYESYLQDAWSSNNGGRSWGQINGNVSYGRRDDANAEITSAGLIVLAGGYAGTKTYERHNDVWLSANGGYTWGLCVKDAAWEDRRYQMTLLDNDGYLWVMGGVDQGEQRLGDVWRSTISFNNVAQITSNCKVTVPSCGAGLLCNPGPGTLIAADGSGAYCDTCPFTFGTQASRVTTLTAFLVVFVILTVLALIALGYTYYKLRSAGTPSPIPLPASAQRWWNKTTAGGAIGSTDTAATTNGDGLYQPLRIRDQV